MSNYDRKTTILFGIQKYCNSVENNFDLFGKDYHIFENNEIFRDAISMEILQIGEFVKNLNKVAPEYIEQTKNEIPWNEIIRMRDRFAHHYGNMDKKIIFDTAITDIPRLNIFLKKELSKIITEKNLKEVVIENKNATINENNHIEYDIPPKRDLSSGNNQNFNEGTNSEDEYDEDFDHNTNNLSSNEDEEEDER